jgi:hypothetical protein
MFKSLRRNDRAAAIVGLIFIGRLLGLACNAAAGVITYNIVDYPVNEGVVSGMGADKISGTIVMDGTLGPISAADILGGTLTFSDPKGDVATGPAKFGSPINLQATPTELLLSSGFSFSISTMQRIPHQTDSVAVASVTYENDPSGGQYYGELGTALPDPLMVVSSFNSAPVSTAPGSIGAASDWVIAAVPEPSAIALLCAAILMLGWSIIIRPRDHINRLRTAIRWNMTDAWKL